MRRSFPISLVIALLLTSVMAFAQGSQQNYPGGKGGCIATVATLSSACNPVKGTAATVTDGSTTSDCTTGGGSNSVSCLYNGSTWGFSGSALSPPGNGVQWGTAIRLIDQAGWNGLNSDVNLVIKNICVAYGGSGVHISIGGGMLPNGTAAAAYGFNGNASAIVLFGSNINPMLACAQSLGKSSVSMWIAFDGAIVVSSSSWDTSQNNTVIDGGTGYAVSGGNPGSSLVMCPYTAGCGPNNYPAWGSGGVLNPTSPVYNFVAGPPFYAPEAGPAQAGSLDYCTANTLTCVQGAAFTSGASTVSVYGMPIAALTTDSVIAYNGQSATTLCSTTNPCSEVRVKSVSGGTGGNCTVGNPCTVTVWGTVPTTLGASGNQIFLYQANILVAVRAGYMNGQYSTSGFSQTHHNYDIDLEGASASCALENESLQERSLFDGVHPVADWQLFPDTASFHRTSYNAYYSTGANSCAAGVGTCLTAGPVFCGVLFQKTWTGTGDSPGPIHYAYRNGGVDMGALPGTSNAINDNYCIGGGAPCQVSSPAVVITYPAATGYIPRCNDGGTARWCPTGQVFEGYSWMLNKPSSGANTIIETGTNEGKVAVSGSSVGGYVWPIVVWVDGMQRGTFMTRAEHFCTLFDMGELFPATFPNDATSDIVLFSPSTAFEECNGSTSQYANEGSTRVQKTVVEMGKSTTGPNHIIGINSSNGYATLYGIYDTINGNALLMSSNPGTGGVNQIGEYKHDALATTITNTNPNCTSLVLGATCADVKNGIVEYNGAVIVITAGVIVHVDSSAGVTGAQTAVIGNGSAAAPSFTFLNSANFGFFSNSATSIGLGTGAANASSHAFTSTGVLETLSGGLFAFASSATNATASKDTGISRAAPGVVAIGAGSQGDTTAGVKAAAYMSVGTKFTTNAGCGESAGANVGGASAGKITTVGSTSCTTIVTVNGATGSTAPNGWSCWVHDITTTADYYNPHVTPTSATTFTIVSGTIVSGDVLEFGCVGY